MSQEQEPTGPFTIGELAERADVTPRTIRYYVSEGLLPPPGGAGQQRVYSYEHLLRLRAIQRFKAEYQPLAEIRMRLDALTLADLEALTREPPAPCNRALSYIDAVPASTQLPTQSVLPKRWQAPAQQSAGPVDSRSEPPT